MFINNIWILGSSLTISITFSDRRHLQSNFWPKHRDAFSTYLVPSLCSIVPNWTSKLLTCAILPVSSQPQQSVQTKSFWLLLIKTSLRLYLYTTFRICKVCVALQQKQYFPYADINITLIFQCGRQMDDTYSLFLTTMDQCFFGKRENVLLKIV